MGSLPQRYLWIIWEPILLIALCPSKLLTKKNRKILPFHWETTTIWWEFVRWGTVWVKTLWTDSLIFSSILTFLNIKHVSTVTCYGLSDYVRDHWLLLIEIYVQDFPKTASFSTSLVEELKELKGPRRGMKYLSRDMEACLYTLMWLFLLACIYVWMGFTCPFHFWSKNPWNYAV